MPDYTKKNLKSEVEDSARPFGMPEGMEAHFSGADLRMSTGGMAYERLESGVRPPFGHSHSEQEEVYVVIEGSGRIKLDDEIVDLERLDAVRIGRGVMRCMEGGPDGIGWIAFGAPKVENAREEAELVQGWWAD
jgi:mannose-6-phosphate isomerase-like protein (cupin superfamily)